MNCFVRLLAIFFVAHVSAGRSAAQPALEHLVPPVVERGKTTRVTVVGRQLDRATDLWSSLPEGSIQATVIERSATTAVFELRVDAKAPVEIAGLRVASSDGLSYAHLFLIDDLPVRLARADGKLELPATVWGTFREAEVDRYRFDVSAGQSLSFETVASRFGKDADPLLTIRDAAGKFVVERDNDPGLYYDCRFEHTFAVAGTYTVEVRDARFRGSPHHQYALRIGRYPAARVALRLKQSELHLPELNAKVAIESPDALGPTFATIRRPGDQGSAWVPIAPIAGEVAIHPGRDERHLVAQALAVAPATTFAFNLSPLRANPFLSVDALLLTGRAQAIRAAVPGTWSGTLRVGGERQAFAFELAKGQSIHLLGEARALNSPADHELTLTDRFGRELRKGTETADGVTLEFQAPANGWYGLTVRDQLRDAGPAFAYRITARDRPFPPTIVAEVEGLTVPQGLHQPIPLVLPRPGAPGPIRLKLVGGPPGLTLAPSEIGEKATAFVAKLSAAPGTPLGLHTVQIVAETPTSPTLVRTRPLIDRQIVNVDLIPLALREDQTRLPPSLTDRFAVQVTPPAPFEFELPEANITLPRYQHAAIPIVTTRAGGFAGPITFTAKGGQLADKAEGRTRVYAEFPVATVERLRIAGNIQSKILSNLGTTRIEVAASASHDGRRVTLTRTFELNLTTAFNVTAEPVKLAPGETSKVWLTANRVKSFDGDVVVRLNPLQGIILPEMIVIPKGQVGVEVEIRAAKETPVGRHNLAGNSTAVVDGFEEEQRVGIELEVRQPKK